MSTDIIATDMQVLAQKGHQGGPGPGELKTKANVKQTHHWKGLGIRRWGRRPGREDPSVIHIRVDSG